MCIHSTNPLRGEATRMAWHDKVSGVGETAISTTTMSKDPIKNVKVCMDPRNVNGGVCKTLHGGKGSMRHARREERG